MKKLILRTVIPAFILSLLPLLSPAQVQPRLAGLETNDEYMSLLDEEDTLRAKEDSLVSAVSDVRNMFRTAPENREQYTKEILKLEGEIFDVRNSIGVVSGKVNAIEQQYIVNNLMTQPDEDKVQASQGRRPANIPAESSRVLVRNDYFRLNMPDEDFAKLLNAQENEPVVLEMANQYKENYNTMSVIASAYLKVEDALTADSLFSTYGSLQRLNDALADSISTIWSDIFDNKAFAYNLVFDKSRRGDLLSFFDRKQREARDDIAIERQRSMSETMTAYPLQKKLIFDYEKTVAELLGYKMSLDSLTQAETTFSKHNLLFPKIELEERLFLDYENAAIYTPAKYNAKNPIPELVVYEKGVIYRILLGTFQRPQPVSVMRGAYPVGYLKTSDNRYAYYAGGYRTLDEAKEAMDALKKAGFRAPKIAVWNYSEYSLLDENALQKSGAGAIYGVEITGTNSLPQPVRLLISEEFPGKEISRSGNSFIVGPFSDREDAQELLDMLRDEDKSLNIKITSSGM